MSGVYRLEYKRGVSPLCNVMTKTVLKMHQQYQMVFKDDQGRSPIVMTLKVMTHD